MITGLFTAILAIIFVGLLLLCFPIRRPSVSVWFSLVPSIGFGVLYIFRHSLGYSALVYMALLFIVSAVLTLIFLIKGILLFRSSVESQLTWLAALISSLPVLILDVVILYGKLQ